MECLSSLSKEIHYKAFLGTSLPRKHTGGPVSVPTPINPIKREFQLYSQLQCIRKLSHGSLMPKMRVSSLGSDTSSDAGVLAHR